MKVRPQLILHADDDTGARPCPGGVHPQPRPHRPGAPSVCSSTRPRTSWPQSRTRSSSSRSTTRSSAQVACPDCGTPRRHKDTPADRCAQPVRHAAPPQPALVALPLRPRTRPTLQPAGRAAPRAHHPGAGRTWRPSSPGWSPTACRANCWASCCPWGGRCTPPRSAARPRPSRSGWRTSSVTSTSASSTAASATGRSCPARTCRWSSAWTAATSTPASNAPAATAGSR